MPWWIALVVGGLMFAAWLGALWLRWFRSALGIPWWLQLILGAALWWWLVAR